MEFPIVTFLQLNYDKTNIIEKKWKTVIGRKFSRFSYEFFRSNYKKKRQQKPIKHDFLNIPTKSKIIPGRMKSCS